MLKLVSFLVCVLVGFSSTAYVDTIKKCSINDQDCLRYLYPTIIKDIASTGIDSLNIPVLEPLELKDLTISFLGILNVTLTKAIVTGISGCTFDAFTVDLEKGSGHQENTCSIKVEGQYKINPSSILKSVLGENNVGGKGNLKLIIDKAHMSFDYPAYAQKRDDGETYIKVDYKNIKYDYEVHGGVELQADNITLGDVETSNSIIPLFNQNWKFMIRTFGKPVVDKAVKIYFDIVGNFFEKVPTKLYITDDLSSIAKP